MKISRILKMVATLILLALGQVSGQAQIQTYNFSGPLDGSAQFGLQAFNPPLSGAFLSTFDMVTETFYYNATAQTVEEVGSVTLNPTSGTFKMGPSGSASLTVGNNSSFSFDIKFADEFVNPPLSGIPPFEGELLVPVSGSGTFNGQAFAGSWNEQLPLVLTITAASASSLTFNENDPGGAGYVDAAPGQLVLPAVGLYDGTGGDDTDYYLWDQESVVATAVVGTAVPEPSTMITDAMMLLPFGLNALRVIRRRQAA
jgi:hypothetical protein